MSEKPLALITGGMRRVGAHIAAKLTKSGYDLALSSHVNGDLDPVLTAALEQSGGDWKGFFADLSYTENAPKLIKEVTAYFGRTPDLLVNNSAIFGQDQWPQMTADSLEAHFGLNLFAPLLLSKALLKSAGSDKIPAIVHILDQRITNPHADQISYTLSKQALAASVRTMATAFAGRARVNGVAPGLVIATEEYDEAQMEKMAQIMPMGALPTPSGVANAVHYLAEASEVTGQILFVDGGANLKSYDRDFMHL